MGGMLERSYLRAIQFERDRVPRFDTYPFNIPALRNLSELSFHHEVTFLVGENGSGKSTLIEAIALALGFGPEGGTRAVMQETAKTTSSLHKYLVPVRGYRRPRDYFFLRAESFYNLATYMDREAAGYLGSYGGKSLHAQSHGESFMATLTTKLRGKGLYLFDEPEAALSPSRQLAALIAIHQLVQAESQFIIATHSPILMAYPNARILLLKEGGIDEVAYEQTEHYAVTREFLTNHRRMLERLLAEPTEPRGA